MRSTGDRGSDRPWTPIGDLSFIDLFAGCGGLASGFVRAGFLPGGAVEIDEDAADTYRRNIKAVVAAADIADVRRWPRADLIVGGPPCQGFSNLGRRDPHDPRNDLWREYVRVLKESRAGVFVMENVPALLGSSQFAAFRKEVDRLGFDVVADVLDAADYGVPQHRKRAFVVGSRIGPASLPEPTHGEGLLPYRTVRQAFSSPFPLTTWPDGRNWHRSRPGVRPQSEVRYAAVPRNGGNRFQMEANLDRQGLGSLVPPCWRKHRTGSTDVFGRMWWERPAPTIRTEFVKPEKGRYLHPASNRSITPREAARLQGFLSSVCRPGSAP